MDSIPFAGIRVNVVAVLRLTLSVASQVPSGCCVACTVSSGGCPPHAVTLAGSPCGERGCGLDVIEAAPVSWDPAPRSFGVALAHMWTGPSSQVAPRAGSDLLRPHVQ